MYVSEIYLRNIGPINEIKITPQFDSDGKPLPILLVGQNGSGKSLTLSVILDALTEARKKKYQSIPELDHDKYIRILSKSYISVYLFTSPPIDGVARGMSLAI
jgi:pantothenate kinase-related protein Tda10